VCERECCREERGSERERRRGKNGETGGGMDGETRRRTRSQGYGGQRVVGEGETERWRDGNERQEREGGKDMESVRRREGGSDGEREGGRDRGSVREGQ